jgi:hypothetical protein
VSHREFTVPSDDEFAKYLGVTPAPGDETGVSVVSIESAAGASVEVVLDVLRRAVTTRLSHQGRTVVEIYREGAVSVRLSREPPELTINFETRDTKGSLKITMPPAAGVAEAVLIA